jgi:hypothetical protein
VVWGCAYMSYHLWADFVCSRLYLGVSKKIKKLIKLEKKITEKTGLVTFFDKNQTEPKSVGLNRFRFFIKNRFGYFS